MIYNKPPLAEVVLEFILPNSIDPYVMNKELSGFLGTDFEQREPITNMASRFYNISGGVTITSLPTIIGISLIGKHYNWNKFKEITNCFSSFLHEKYNIDEFSGLKLVYINIISTGCKDGDLLDVNKYFEIISSKWAVDGLGINILTRYNGSKDILSCEICNIPLSEIKDINDVLNNKELMFSLKYLTTGVEKVNYNDVSRWLENAHETLVLHFDTSITEYCKELFEKK